jgi:CubicO group peptidase (beta-lactamase class C family)
MEDQEALVPGVDPARTPPPAVAAVRNRAAPEEVRAAITTMMRAAHVPGLSIAMVRAKRLLFADAFGVADLAAGTPATVDTSYLWFSMSKPVTATAALRLADEGRLDLDAPASQYVPFLRVRRTGQPTTRQLLTHTAGLANPLPIRWVHPAGAPAPDARALLRRELARRRLVHHATGDAGRYSNLNYLAAAEVIAAAAGTPFPEYVREAVLVPAAMTGTGYGYLAGRPAARGYVRAPRVVAPLVRVVLPRGIVGDRHGAFVALRPFLVDGPGYGGLVGDVLDAARFARLHLGDGRLDGRRVLAADTARAMRRIVAPGKPFDHATGWFRKPVQGGTADYVEHYGAGAGFWNVLRLYPDRDLGIVVMTNSTTTYPFHDLFERLAAMSWPS